MQRHRSYGIPRTLLVLLGCNPAPLSTNVILPLLTLNRSSVSRTVALICRPYWLSTLLEMLTSRLLPALRWLGIAGFQCPGHCTLFNEHVYFLLLGVWSLVHQEDNTHFTGWNSSKSCKSVVFDWFTVKKQKSKFLCHLDKELIPFVHSV